MDLSGSGGGDLGSDDEGMVGGSGGSLGDDAHTPDSDSAGGGGRLSDLGGLSSPGGLSLGSLTSPSLVLPSPGTSASIASPCMSLQSPLTPHHPEPGGNQLSLPPPQNPPSSASSSLSSASSSSGGSANLPPPHRNPVGTNPHDINNPLSVNQLTGQVKETSGARVISVT
ncbi:hypothetical protein B566_EDAN008286 [Ephemera danica]|nr:hypothetical protein B566_EDAN008286 [Ephemera danica]